MPTLLLQELTGWCQDLMKKKSDDVKMELFSRNITFDYNFQKKYQCVGVIPSKNSTFISLNFFDYWKKALELCENRGKFWKFCRDK